MAWKKQEGTKHSNTCTKAFNRFDPSCPRCQELITGSTSRKGWSDHKGHQETQGSLYTAHNCIVSGCGPVCTYGDW